MPMLIPLPSSLLSMVPSVTVPLSVGATGPLIQAVAARRARGYRRAMDLLRRVAYGQVAARIQKIMSENNTGNEGAQCHECEHTHDDWNKDGQHTVNAPPSGAVVERYECGICGVIMEVPRY